MPQPPKQTDLISGEDLISYGKQFLGKPYVWGATGPNAFDCSGLVQYIFRHFGISLPRVTYDQVKQGTAVTRGNEQVGDLIFSSWDGKPNSHVGIYAGNGKILAAGKPVQLTDLNENYWNHVTAIRHISGISGGGTATWDSGGGGDFTGTTEDQGILSALSGIAGSISSMTQSVARIGQVADALLKLALPTNMVRLGAGIFGIGFIAFGLFFLIGAVTNA